MPETGILADQLEAARAEVAAEKFCYKYDGEMDYRIISRGDGEVETRKPRSAEIEQWDISAESVPQYRAFAK